LRIDLIRSAQFTAYLFSQAPLIPNPQRLRSTGEAMKRILAHFIRDESGVTAIEYGLIASLVGVAIIVGATLLGTALNDTLVLVASTMAAASSPSP
jgi:pilus assembly protein Flp/PilA